MWIGSWKKKCWAARHNFLPIPGKTFQHGKKRETGGRVLNIFWVVQLIVSKKGENILLKGQFNITRLYPCLISKLGSFWTYIRSISFLPISTLSASATLSSLYRPPKPYHPLAINLSCCKFYTSFRSCFIYISSSIHLILLISIYLFIYLSNYLYVYIHFAFSFERLHIFLAISINYENRFTIIFNNIIFR